MSFLIRKNTIGSIRSYEHAFFFIHNALRCRGGIFLFLKALLKQKKVNKIKKKALACIFL